jgi:hypothetical protein
MLDESVSLQENSPIYDLSTMLSQALEGNLLDSPLRDLMFSSCVRGGSRLYLYEVGFDSP